MAKQTQQHDGGDKPKRRRGGKGSRTTAKKVQRLEDRPAPERAAEPTHDGSGGQPPRNLPTIDFHPEGDDEGFDADGMKPRWLAFVDAYCGEAGGNATRAASIAGYSDNNANAIRSTASRLLTIANIQRAISRRMAAKFGNAEDVTNSIAQIARGNAADYVEWNNAGQLQISIEKLAAAGQMGLVHEIREEGIDAGGGQVVVIKRKLKLYDKLRALELLAKINGQLKDQPVMPAEMIVKHVWNDPKTGAGVSMRDLLNPNAEGGDPPDDPATDVVCPHCRRVTAHDPGDGVPRRTEAAGSARDVNGRLIVTCGYCAHEFDYGPTPGGTYDLNAVHPPNGSDDGPPLCPFCGHGMSEHGDASGCVVDGCTCTNRRV